MSSEVVQVFRVVYRFIFFSLSLSLSGNDLSAEYGPYLMSGLSFFFFLERKEKKNKGTVGRETESWVGSG